jgi:hypothetical protein
MSSGDKCVINLEAHGADIDLELHGVRYRSRAPRRGGGAGATPSFFATSASLMAVQGGSVWATTAAAL